MVTANQFEKITAVLPFPVYVFREDKVGVICDKLFGPKDFSFRKTRYIITAGKQCTCLGYIKAGDCRHLKMLRGEYDWIKNGVPNTLMVETLQELCQELKDILPRSVEGWVNMLKESDFPEVVRGMEMVIRDQTKRSAIKVVAIKNFADRSSLAMTFLFANS